MSTSYCTSRINPADIIKSLKAPRSEIFDTAYNNWLRANNFEETSSIHTAEWAIIATIVSVDDKNDPYRGLIIRDLKRVELSINVSLIHGLDIDPIAYLSILDGYAIDIRINQNETGTCWLGHENGAGKTVCCYCKKERANLRKLREAGLTWLLTDIMPDIKQLIARWLSRFALSAETRHHRQLIFNQSV